MKLVKKLIAKKINKLIDFNINILYNYYKERRKKYEI